MQKSFGLRWLTTLGLALVPATAMSSGPFDGSCERGCRLRSGTRRSQGVQVEFHRAGAGRNVPGSIQPYPCGDGRLA
jgi:hypothetical protein